MSKRYSTTKGTIYLTISQFFFFICGYAIHIFLGRKLGPDIYGIYGIVMSILLWAEMTVLSGMPQAFTKLVSENLDLAGIVCSIIKKMYLPFSIGVMMIFFLLSPLISASLGDNRLLPLLIIAGLDIPFHGLFISYRSMLNGGKEYLKESIARVTYVFSRAIFIIILVIVGFSITGALIGNILGSIFALILAYCFVNSMRGNTEQDEILHLIRRILTFGTPMLLYAITDSLVVNIDFWLVKAILSNDFLTGYYSAAYTITRLPFFLIMGLTAALFPSLSKSIYNGDVAQSKSILSQAIRVCFVTLFPLCVIISTTSEDLVELLYSSEYLPAAHIVKILIYGISFYSIYEILHVAVIAQNKPILSFLFALILVPIAVLLNVFLIPIYQLKGAALATTFTMSIGIVIVGTYIYRRFRVLIRPYTFVRVAVGSIILYCISNQMPMDHLLLLLKYGILIMIYGVFMFLTGEVTKDDISMVRAILPFRR